LEFAKHFKAKGWEVLTFYANYKGPKTDPLFIREKHGGYDYVHVKAPHYVGNGLKRMYSIWKFAQTIKKHAYEFEKPDVILHNVHAPFDYPIVNTAKKLGARYISEVWDLWPDNFANFGMISRSNPAMKVFYRIERWIYEHADQLVFTIPGALQYLQDKGWTTNKGGKIDMSRVHYINNGIDLEQFDKYKVAYPRPDEDMNRDDCFKVVYLGTINYANHVQTLIDAAALLQEDKNYQFFIYGDGVHREQLEQYVKEKGIKNVHFKEKRIPFCECAWVVTQATVNIMTYEKGFGYMGVSSGKMFQYLAAGKPIVCNINIAYDNVIQDNELGVARDIITPEEFAQAIRNCAEQPCYKYQGMCERVRKTAEQFDYKVLAQREIAVIEAALAEH
jgi:glycosyltransferase involved in cell wall biosynthesis